VLAVAIALWRAHGDSMSGGGVFEYYRRLACGWSGGTLLATAPAADVITAGAVRLRHDYRARIERTPVHGKCARLRDGDCG